MVPVNAQTTSGAGYVPAASAPTTTPVAFTAAEDRRRDRIGFPASCPYFSPKTDGYPSDSASLESDAILKAVHGQCFAVLGSADDDPVLSGDRRIVVAVHWPTGDAKGQRLFFFAHNRLVGTDTRGYLPMVAGAHRTGPDAFEADYAGVGTTTGAAASPVSELKVRFTWPRDGVPRAIDPLPSDTYPDCPQPDYTASHFGPHTQGQVTCWY